MRALLVRLFTEANRPSKPLTFHANIAPAPGPTLQYAWTVNAQPQGGNTSEFTFTPNNFGVFQDR